MRGVLRFVVVVVEGEGEGIIFRWRLGAPNKRRLHSFDGEAVTIPVVRAALRWFVARGKDREKSDAGLPEKRATCRRAWESLGLEARLLNILASLSCCCKKELKFSEMLWGGGGEDNANKTEGLCTSLCWYFFQRTPVVVVEGGGDNSRGYSIQL